MATHSSVLAWRIPETGEPGGLLSLGSHRVGHDWSDLAAAAAASSSPCEQVAYEFISSSSNYSSSRLNHSSCFPFPQPICSFLGKLVHYSSCKLNCIYWVLTGCWSFPSGSEVKASACNAGDLGSIPGSGRSSGEGNGDPFQYSCLENLVDGGAWLATVHGVTKRTQSNTWKITATPLSRGRVHIYVLQIREVKLKILSKSIHLRICRIHIQIIIFLLQIS